jgi:CubicO group peptidase (beta-lactamase class C family)
MHYDAAKVKNVDERKNITLKHVLTMTTGLEWSRRSRTTIRNDANLMEHLRPGQYGSIGQ